MKLLVRSYAALLILHGLANATLLAILFFKEFFPREFMPYLVWCNNAALLTGLALYKTPLNFVIGYGLFRFRGWARYGIFAGLATLPILMVTERLWWGEYRLHAVAAAFLVISVCITLVLFTRPSVRELFTGKPTPRLKIGTGLLATGVVLLAFIPLLGSLTIKKFMGKCCDVPVFQHEKLNSPLPPEASSLVQIRLMGCSLPVYAGSSIMNYDRIGFSRNPWRFVFRGSKRLVEYGNHSMYEATFEELPFVDIRGYDLEKFFFTNQWNPLVLLLRGIGRPQGNQYVVRQVETTAARGFVTMLDDKVKNGRRRVFASFSLFEMGGTRCVSGTALITEDPGPKAETVLSSLISSIRFLEPEKPRNAEGHFRQGKIFLETGNKLAAQVELANAYYLAPGSKEYREAFEATLFKSFQDLPHTWGELSR